MPRPLIAAISKAILLLGAILILLALTGVAYEALGRSRDARRFPQHGRSVQAGRIKLNLDCTGDRSPGRTTIVLDSGLGAPALGWILIQPEVAKFARVCSYDRAGYGWSDPGPEPRTSSQIAKELKAVLDAAAERPPYVMVGHSFGGFNVRVFTSLYPGEVAGVVLVEASHEDEDHRIAELLPPSVMEREVNADLWNERIRRIIRPVRVRFGIERLQVETGWGTPDYGILKSTRLPKDLRQELLYLRQQDKVTKAVAAEIHAFQESILEVRRAGALGDRPLIVLTAANPYDPDPILTREQVEKLKNLWIHDLQVQEAHLSTHGKQIIVPDSTHMIPIDQPAAVVSAIHEVWSANAQ